MKKILLLLLAIAASANAAITDTEWDALIAVESERGRTSANVAQIRRILVDDLNRILDGVSYDYDDRECPIKSREMFNLYTTYYGGEGATFEQRARIWNGGPKGNTKNQTRYYWNKIKKELDKIERGDS